MKYTLATIKRVASKARTSRIPAREEPGEAEDKAEAAQYEAGEEGNEQIGPASHKRANVGAMTPRRPKRPY